MATAKKFREAGQPNPRVTRPLVETPFVLIRVNGRPPLGVRNLKDDAGKWFVPDEFEITMDYERWGGLIKATVSGFLANQPSLVSSKVTRTYAIHRGRSASGVSHNVSEAPRWLVSTYQAYRTYYTVKAGVEKSSKLGLVEFVKRSKWAKNNPEWYGYKKLSYEELTKKILDQVWQEEFSDIVESGYRTYRKI